MTRAGAGGAFAALLRGGLVVAAAVLLAHGLSLWWARGPAILLDLSLTAGFGCF